jgi:hypothetical protein
MSIFLGNISLCRANELDENIVPVAMDPIVSPDDDALASLLDRYRSESVSDLIDSIRQAQRKSRLFCRHFSMYFH